VVFALVAQQMDGLTGKIVPVKQWTRFFAKSNNFCNRARGASQDGFFWDNISTRVYVMNKEIISQTHPSHYLMHKYWGRKAHNLIAEHIAHYTRPNDIVLDPFMGSGGVLIESKKIGRRSIGVDINPITKLIVDNTIDNLDPQDILDTLPDILEKVPKDIFNLSVTKCPTCKNQSTLLNAVWNGSILIRVKGRCSEHSQFVKDADDFDLRQIESAKKILTKYEKTGLYYPTDQILDFVKRNGNKYINELFTERNLVQSAYLLSLIDNIKDKKIKKVYQMIFTSMLPNVSNMIPANSQTVSGKSGWQISKFWAPSCHTEKNVYESFAFRAKSVYKGKLQTKNVFSTADHAVYIQSAENLSFLPSDSIDYIFTDPPYGDSIAYLGLSMFWNSWLRYDVDYEGEIIHDPYRKKGHTDYKNRLENVFSELHRVLKPGKQMSFTFHNRSLKFWKIVIDAVMNSGFELSDITWHAQATSSGTQGINRRNTLKGDFVYSFKKPKNVQKQGKLILDTVGEAVVIAETEKLLNEYSFIETAKLYEILIPEIVKKRAFLDANGKILDIEKILAERFKYIKMKHDDQWHYGWAES
jgi:DNA modification methylase